MTWQSRVSKTLLKNTKKYLTHSGFFHKHVSVSISAGFSNHMPSKVRDGIAFPFPNWVIDKKFYQTLYDVCVWLFTQA